MSKYLLLLTAFILIGSSVNKELDMLKQETIDSILLNYVDKDAKELFKVFYLVYGKQYQLDSEEAKSRFQNFKKTLKIINESNSKDLPYKLGINKYSDLSEEEWRKKLTRRIRTKAEFDRDFADATFLSAEDDDDLTKRNLQSTMTTVTWQKYYGTVRDQGNCSDCWAFAATAIVEGCFAMKQGKPYQYLSAQQVLDCDTSGQYGCDGGDTIAALAYIKSNGLEADTSYTYSAVQGNCKFSSSKVAAKITGSSYCSNYYKKGSCTALIVNVMLQKGPLAVGIDGGTSGFQNYKSGIFTGACSNDDHAVTLVGYGIDSKLGDYMIIRNSWGASWGMSGYINIKRNDANNLSCFTNNEAVACTC